MNANFWSMGGYAQYVWPCFAVWVVIFVWNIWSARRLRAAALKRASRALAMSDTEAQ